MRMHALIFHALVCIHAHWRSMQFLRGRGGTGRPGPGCLCLGVRGGVPWWRWRWRWPWVWWGFATAKAARKPIHMRHGELSQPAYMQHYTTQNKTKKKIASQLHSDLPSRSRKTSDLLSMLGRQGNESRSTYSQVF